MTRFTYGATTVQFARDPARPGGIAPRLPQQRERDSDGAVYVYAKTAEGRTAHRLRFDGHNAVDDATLAALKSFLRTTVLGVRRSFTWTDHLGTERTVRFQSPRLNWRPVGPDRNAVEILLEEEP